MAVAATRGAAQTSATGSDPGPATGMQRTGAIEVRVSSMRYAARDTLIYELQHPGGGALPAAQAGAHIGLHLPNGLVRQYSLIEAGAQPWRYLIGVKRDAQGRGGSRFMHDELRPGCLLDIDPPRNNFPLNEEARHTVLIAGGIGITPILCMARRLRQLGRSWSLFYACRARDYAAFLPELAQFEETHIHFDAEAQRTLDVASIVRAAPPDAHLYCCGPTPMLETFEAAVRDWPREQIHVEYFTAKEVAAVDGGHRVSLARSGQTFEIPPGKTILQVLREGGVDVPFSCEQGVCGACETRVLNGVPDHRDAILSEPERAANDTMMICCSGCKSGDLVLGL